MESSKPAVADLVRVCLARASAEAWEDLVHQVQPPMARAARRTLLRYGNSALEDVDEIVQDVLLTLARDRRKLLPLLSSLSDGAIVKYFMTMAANASVDLMRARGAAKRGESRTVSLDELAERFDMEFGAPDRQLDFRLLTDKIDRILSGMERDRQIFWLYYRHDLTASAIARIPHFKLTVKGVESVIYRLTRIVRESL